MLVLNSLIDAHFEHLLEKIPVHLWQYVVEQEYKRYTPRDQAVWRLIMRNNLKFLSRHAHKAYMDGLGKTDINIEKIPDVLNMNRQLEKIGWNAVVVNGFIPLFCFEFTLRDRDYPTIPAGLLANNQTTR